jgi:aspartate/methionine/tyrosine aminotransferase
VPIGFREEGQRFRWDIDQLEKQAGEQTKVIILNTPSNPVGCSIERADLERIAEVARRYDIFVLADEIYSRILYEGTFTSIAALPGMAERTCILDGFSKTYAMTGWRLGYGVMPENVATAVSRLATNCNSCTATFTQMAGLEALTGPQDSVDTMVAEFRRRRDLVVEGLNAIRGVKCSVPQGAFYAYPNIQALGMSSKQLADLLLYEGGVAVLSGTAFGANGEGYLRLSYANSYENLEIALERMKSTIESHAGVTAQGS